MRVLWLADVLRAAGLDVVEVPGWTSLGSASWSPTGGIVHATADGAAANPVADAKDDAAAIGVIRNGRADLPGPIANAYQSRAGVWHVIASGRCNTALTGTAGPLKGLGNHNLLGIEHENDNRTEPWPQVQYQSAVIGWAAICRRMGWTAARLAGHKEHDPARKSDPKGIDMARFRRDVAAALAGEKDDMQLSDSIKLVTGQAVAYSSPKTTVGGVLASTNYYTLVVRNMVLGLRAEVASLRAVVDTLAEVIRAGGGSVDTAAILAGVDQRLAALPTADEVADAVADEAAARLAG